MVREVIGGEGLRGKEVQMQRLAQMTEYFNGRDLVEVAKRVIEGGKENEKEIEEVIVQYKAQCFP